MVVFTMGFLDTFQVIGNRPIKQNFVINYESLHKAIQANNPKMVVIVNPNSPTGQYWDKKQLLHLIKTFPSVIFVIDETYIDYIGKKKSIERETKKNANLVVIKSMSKVYALSGARVGYIVAHPTVLCKISPFIPPWSVSLVGQIAGIEALKDNEYYEKKYAKTAILREKMIENLKNEPIIIFNSVANFFLIQIKNGSTKEIISKLRKQNIYLRNCDSMSTQFNDNFIRVAVKDEKTNKIIVNALKKLLTT